MCPILSSVLCQQTTNLKQSRHRTQARTRATYLCCGENCMPSEHCSVLLQVWHICGLSNKGGRKKFIIGWHVHNWPIATSLSPTCGLRTFTRSPGKIFSGGILLNFF